MPQTPAEILASQDPQCLISIIRKSFAVNLQKGRGIL